MAIAAQPSNLCIQPKLFHLITIFFLLFVYQGLAESRFGGGMTGYFQYANMPITDDQIRGLAWGLGGILNYNLSRNFRVSCMGSTYRLGYESPGMKGSYMDLGYGGLCLEYCIPVKSDNLAFGLMFGGGKMTNLFVWSKMPEDSIFARYESDGIMIGTPIISYEHALTKAVFALLRIDYLAGFRDGAVFTFGSPGLRIGIIFKK
jgi:hypothetical protein